MTTDKNRFVAEKLGLCWHEPVYDDDMVKSCSCGRPYLYASHPPNPDFRSDAGAVQLLRLMMEYKLWWKFRVDCKAFLSKVTLWRLTTSSPLASS